MCMSACMGWGETGGATSETYEAAVDHTAMSLCVLS